MQKIFSREIRFKDNNGNSYPDWEEKKLGSIIDEVVKKTTTNNQHEILSSTINGLFKQSEIFDRKIASSNNIGYKIIEINQLVLSPQNLWLGNINFNKKYVLGIVSPSYKIFKIKKSLDPQYINYIIKLPKMLHNYITSSEQGASIVRRNLNMDLFLQIKLNIPFLGEQKKIVNFLSAIDSKIETTSTQIDKTKEFKKGLLQQMFV